MIERAGGAHYARLAAVVIYHCDVVDGRIIGGIAREWDAAPD
jgi:hypothetical protein